ncbi:MAG: hypothetical protein WCY39_00055 [Oscillospiraceae bacterium]
MGYLAGAQIRRKTLWEEGMNISRNFLVIGALYLVAGMGFGTWMSMSEQFAIAPVHAHMNLLGFVLMTVFGLAYRMMPELAADWMAPAHFWLHQAGTLVFVIFLWLLLSERMAGAVAGPILSIAELAIILGALIWLWNLWRSRSV